MTQNPSEQQQNVGQQKKTCEVCHQTFNSDRELQDHMQTAHSQRKQSGGRADQWTDGRSPRTRSAETGKDRLSLDRFGECLFGEHSVIFLDLPHFEQGTRGMEQSYHDHKYESSGECHEQRSRGRKS